MSFTVAKLTTLISKGYIDLVDVDAKCIHVNRKKCFSLF